MHEALPAREAWFGPLGNLRKGRADSAPSCPAKILA
jgi:hypothetical protein